MTRITSAWLVCFAVACGSSERDAPSMDAGSSDAVAGDAVAGDVLTAGDALVLTTRPAPRMSAAVALMVPTTVKNRSVTTFPIELDRFYVVLTNGVLSPAFGTSVLASCPPKFGLLPGGSIECNLEFLVNTGIVRELRYDDGSDLPARVEVTERPVVPGCVASEVLSSCFTERTESALFLLSLRGVSCADPFMSCRTSCMRAGRRFAEISDCTCDAECLQQASCPEVESAIQAELACQPQ